ncbi:MAG TPA: glycosyltransferase family 4 protein [Candidatus Acidoferrales bacterium]|nr:glycosyltransferase family 4 protein [Candidatus Acidoferrales bacterium]
MRILHLDTRPDWRGGQLQILLTLRGLRERGHDAQLMARRDSPLAHRAAAEGFSVHLFPPRFLRLQAALCLREILDQQAFDILHAHDPHGLTAAWLTRANRRSRLVVARRVAYPLSRAPLSLARYRAAHRIIAVSRFVADSVIASGINSSRIAVVYDGVEISPLTTIEERRVARARWKISDDDLLLGCVGYLLPEKGQETLLRALPQIRARFPNCRVILAGDGPCRAKLQSLARDLAIVDAVIFAGFVEDVESVYRALDLFVFPSLAEPLGSSLLAAMAHGLPVIAVASGGVPEIIENGSNGILVDSPDALKFAASICQMLDDRNGAARMAKAARETVECRFSARLLAENTLQQYQTILSAHEKLSQP